MEQQNVGSKRSASGGSGKIAAKSQEAAQQVKDAVTAQADQMREKASNAKAQTSERIRGVATQLQNMSNTLRDDDPFVADLAERAGRSIDNVAEYVSSRDARALLRDTEQLARRQPALFFGSAFLIGLAAGRFLKSSAPRSNYDRFGEREGGPLASTRDRESGFFPQSESSQSEYSQTERSARSNRRFQENYDATFATGTNEYSPNERSTSTSQPITPTPSRDVSRTDESVRTGLESAGNAEGRGERP